MSELEKLRLANIERNKELLAALSLPPAMAAGVKAAEPEPSTPRKYKKRNSAQFEDSEEAEPPRSRRKSRRLQGLEPDKIKQEDLDTFELRSLVETERRKRVSGHLGLPDMVKVKREEGLDESQWTNSLGELFGGDVKSQGDLFGIKVEDDEHEDTKDPDIKTSRDNLSGLEMRKMAKMTVDRVFYTAFHPGTDKRVVLAGDKTGVLGIWDVDSDNEPFQFKIHARTISSFVFDQNVSDKLYSSSYDGSVRSLDLKTGQSSEVLVFDDNPSDPIGISDVAHPEPHLLYATTLEGQLVRKDTRTPEKDFEVFRLHDKKIGGFSVDPVNTHLLASGSLDRTMRVWDLRATETVRNFSTGEVLDSLEMMPHLQAVYNSRLSVSSTDWNRAGQIVCNGYDDTINIFNQSDYFVDLLNDGNGTEPVRKQRRARTSEAVAEWKAPDIKKPSIRIRHNCQSGRWVTILKARWQQDPQDGVQKFAIANMNRFIDVYSGTGHQLAHLGDELMTAVPSALNLHPTQNWIAGGNSSGKMYFYD